MYFPPSMPDILFTGGKKTIVFMVFIKFEKLTFSLQLMECSKQTGNISFKSGKRMFLNMNIEERR